MGITPDEIYGKYTQNLTNLTVASLQPGDWAWFINVTDIAPPGWAWDGENVITTGCNSFVGWDFRGAHSAEWWNGELCRQYNILALQRSKAQISVNEVPGYTGHSFFLNIPVLAKMMFGVRSGESS